MTHPPASQGLSPVCLAPSCGGRCCLLPVSDPASSRQKAAVWEITGAEFSKSEAHTADGISIRFPRCTRIRDDKDWKSATNLPQLKVPAARVSSTHYPSLETVGIRPVPTSSVVVFPSYRQARTGRKGHQTVAGQEHSAGHRLGAGS